MIRTFPQPNTFRTTPLPAPDRSMPLPFEETPLRVFQGSAQNVELGHQVCPFRGFSATSESLITQVRYQKDTEGWNEISQGSYPTLGKAVQSVSFTPVEFGEYSFLLEVTAGDFQVTRTVNIISSVRAGQDKVIRKNAGIKPFFDSKFSIDSSLLSSVEYSVDEAAPAAIPATFGLDLVTRVKNFAISWATGGEKKVSLIVKDTESNESSDFLIVRVGS